MHKDIVEDGWAYMGALFFTLTWVAMFNGISELNTTLMKLSVFYKQRDLLFYPSRASSAYVNSNVVVACVDNQEDVFPWIYY